MSRSCDSERQGDEVSAISSIYDCNEFSYSRKDMIECSFNVFLNINDGELTIQNTSGYDQKFVSESPEKHTVRYLPPIRFYANLPHDYPSKGPPMFFLVVSWLPPWETSFLCQKLDEIWEDNKGSEILFMWLDFLRNDVFSFLGIRGTLDISFMCTIYDRPEEYLKWNMRSLTDSRAANRGLFLNPVQFLMNYNKDQSKVEFERQYHECHICFEEYIGQKCIRFDGCDHAFCKDCIRRYITFKINSAAVKDILCPDSRCNFAMTSDEIKNICPDLFSKYEKLVLQITLNTMSDVVYCPRNFCQSPVIRETDETLAVCSNCGYSFCSYCFKVYHGIEPCAMTSDKVSRLIEEYQYGDQQQRKTLEKKYGRKQIEVVVEKHLTKEYLKSNAKSCPNCHTLVTKIDGCNKMICIHCQASFCWLCEAHITSANAYDHFIDNRATCYGRLFEGVHKEDLNDIDNVDIMENVLWFNEQDMNNIIFGQ